MSVPELDSSARYVADLVEARQQMVNTVLHVRARYESSGPSAEGQQLLSAAVKDLEDVDAALSRLRERRSL